MTEEVAGHRPPHSPDAEKSVLGAMLLDQELAVESLDSLSEEDFFDRKHRMIFRACRELDSKNSVIDMVTVSEELSRMKRLEEAGGIDYLAALTDDIPLLSISIAILIMSLAESPLDIITHPQIVYSTADIHSKLPLRWYFYRL